MRIENFGADRKFRPSGSLDKASWCQTVTLGTEFSIRTSHPCKILILRPPPPPPPNPAGKKNLDPPYIYDRNVCFVWIFHIVSSISWDMGGGGLEGFGPQKLWLLMKAKTNGTPMEHIWAPPPPPPNTRCNIWPPTPIFYFQPPPPVHHQKRFRPPWI